MDAAIPQLTPTERILMGVIVASLVFFWLRLVALGGRLGLFRASDRPRPAWSTAAVTYSVLVYILISVGVSLVYQYLEHPSGEQNVPAAHQLLLMTVVNGLVILILPRILRAESGLTLNDLGLASWRVWLRDARLGVLMCVVLLPLVYGVFSVAQNYWVKQDHPAEQSIRDQWSPTVAGLVLLSAVIMAPIAEELLFRGVLLGWLETVASRWNKGKGWGWVRTWLPNILVSVIFAAIHGPQWPAPLPLFVLSMGLGSLVQTTGRLGASIAAHMLFNGLSTLTLFVAAANGNLERELPRPAAQPQPAGAAAILKPGPARG